MKHLNWFTILSLFTLVSMVVLGTFVIATDGVTLNVIAAGLVMGTAAITTAALSLHDR